MKTYSAKAEELKHEWVLIDAVTVADPIGVGLATSRIHDEAGAVGLTVAKVGELEALLPAFAGRQPDFLLAYPAVDEPRTRRLAGSLTDVTVRASIVDVAGGGLDAAKTTISSTDRKSVV